MAAVAVIVVFLLAPAMIPTGVLELVLASTVCTSSSDTPREAAATGSTWILTANFWGP